MQKRKSTTKLYSVLYAEDIPCYGTAQLRAATDDEALEKARRLADTDRDLIILDPDWTQPFCKRLIHIEADDGRVIAENIALDHARVIAVAPCCAARRLEDVTVYRVQDAAGEIIGFTLSQSPGCEPHCHVPVDPGDPGAPLLLAAFSTPEEAAAFAEGLAYGRGEDAGYQIAALTPYLTCVLAEFFTGDPPSLRYADLRQREADHEEFTGHMHARTNANRKPAKGGA
jgi:hypothetical protein